MNKLFTKIATLSVGLAMAVGVGVAVGNNTNFVKKAEAAATSGEYTKVTNAANLAAGDRVIFVNAAGTKALTGLSVNGNGGYGTITDVTVSNSKISLLSTTSVAQFIVEAGASQGYAFKAQNGTNINGNYIAYSGSGNSLGKSQNNTAEDTTSQFTLTYSSTSPAHMVVQNVASTTRWLRFNSDRFACYSKSGSESTTGTGVDVWKRTGDYVVPEASTWTVGDITSGLYPGRTAQAVVTPPDGYALPSLTYTSGDTSIFTVDATGKITAVSAGTTTLTVAKTGGSPSFSGNITVSAFPAPAGITLNSYYVMSSDNNDVTYELTNIENNGGTTTAVGGSFSKAFLFKAVGGAYDNTIAFQADDGKYLKANSVSNANIGLEQNKSAASSWVVQYSNNVYTITNSQVYGINNSRQLLMNVQDNINKIGHYVPGNNYRSVGLTAVTNPITDFTIESEKTIFVGTQEQIEYSFIPVNPTEAKTLSWSSSNTNIAEVSSTGVVTAKVIGEVTITASKTIGGNLVEKTCAVSIIDSVARHKGTLADPYTSLEAYYIAKDTITKDFEDDDVVKTGAYVKGLLTKINVAKKDELTIWLGESLSQISAATKGFEVFRAAKVYTDNLGDRYSTNAEAAAEFVVGATVIAKGDITTYGQTSEFGEGCEVVYSSYIEALDFARGFNTSVGGVCDGEKGNTDPTLLGNAWSAQDTAYGQLEEIEQAHILSSASNRNGNDIEKMVAKYDYIVAKYNSSKTTPYNDFLGRIEAGKITLGSYVNGLNVFADNNKTDSTAIILISVISTFAVGAFFFTLKKKKTK